MYPKTMTYPGRRLWSQWYCRMVPDHVRDERTWKLPQSSKALWLTGINDTWVVTHSWPSQMKILPGLQEIHHSRRRDAPLLVLSPPVFGPKPASW